MRSSPIILSRGQVVQHFVDVPYVVDYSYFYTWQSHCRTFKTLEQGVEQGQDNGAHFNEGGGGGVFAEKSTMGLAFEMAAVVLNSACASSSFSDMLLVGCFHYHVCQPTAYL